MTLPFDPERMMETAISMKRREISAAMSEVSDDVTQVEAYEMLKELESDCMDHLPEHIPGFVKKGAVVQLYFQFPEVLRGMAEDKGE